MTCLEEKNSQGKSQDFLTLIPSTAPMLVPRMEHQGGGLLPEAQSGSKLLS